jgi:diaminopropionate ammonia-lyase
VIVNDLEAHHSVQYLQDHGVNAGPCGAAPLAALRKLHERGFLPNNGNAVVVLFSTEGNREYASPEG